ncbi:MAG: universal stress protein [Haloarculaceae archaeon]
MFDTVVIATDGSASVQRAVETALTLAADFDASVRAVSVVAPDAEGGRERAETALDALAALADREVATAVREGDPASEICAHAREHGADLIAMGTRGRGGDSFHLGSVAERVVERAEPPVLTVRQLSGMASA